MVRTQLTSIRRSGVITAFVAERVTVVEATNEHAEKLQARLPEGLYAAPFYDAAEIYRDRLALLLRNARIGLVLVLLILGLFLEARLAF